VVRRPEVSGQSDEPLFRQTEAPYPMKMTGGGGCSQKVSRRRCKVKQSNRL
jgi:hypothetical protein